MSQQITEKILRNLEGGDLTELLSDKLSGSELHSVLLTVLKRRVSRIETAQLIRPNAVAVASELDGRLLNQVEHLAYSVVPQFEAVELSPVTPLGAIAALTELDQGNILSTIRSFECASDPTVGLALECARRRKHPEGRREPTRVCAQQRVLRFPSPQKAGFSAHFKLFSLVSAARDTGSFSFEIMALREQIESYLELMSRLTAVNFIFRDIEVELSDTRVVAHLCSRFGIGREEIRASVRALDPESSVRLLEKHSVPWPRAVERSGDDLASYDLPEPLIVQMGLLEERVCATIRALHKEVRVNFNLHRLTGLGYYEGPCFHIKADDGRGEAFALADGGFVDWTRRLLGDNKERLLTSAIGTELMCRLFHHSPAIV